VCLVFAYVITWTPTGRHIVFVGANREVAWVHDAFYGAGLVIAVAVATLVRRRTSHA
jgi:ribose/xylose/arabinose/galactoside ABC-type transport system permease subunit